MRHQGTKLSKNQETDVRRWFQALLAEVANRGLATRRLRPDGPITFNGVKVWAGRNKIAIKTDNGNHMFVRDHSA